jgi:type I restriction enzyme S subunit
MKPGIRFGEFTDAWEQRKLDNIADVRDGTHDSPQYYSKGHPLVTSKNVKDGYINYDDIQYISDADFEMINKRSKVEKNDILMGMIGTIGNIALVREEPDFAIKNVALIKDIKKICYVYLYHNLQSSNILDQLSEGMDGGTQKFIALNKIRNLTISIPKYEEQQKIGTFFTSLDNLITLHQRKLDKMKNLKSAYLSKMFPKEGERYPRLRFAGFTDAWEQRKLGNMGKTYTGLSGKTKDDFGHGDAEFVTYMNVFSNPVSNSNQTENVEIDERQNEVKYGDIFFTTSSEIPEEVGMSSVWLGNKANVYLNSFCFGYRPTEKLDPYYMAYMLRSAEIRRKFQFLAQGISRYNISKAKVMDLSVYIPKLEEQAAIGHFFINLDNLITLHQRELEKLKQLKQAMLQKMFV